MNFDDLKVNNYKKRNITSNKHSSPLHNAFNYSENGGDYNDFSQSSCASGSLKNPFSSHQKVNKNEYWDCKENIRASEPR